MTIPVYVVEGRSIFTRKMADIDSYMEHLIKVIEPVMKTGELIVENAISLAEEYKIDLNSTVNWEDMPVDFRERLQVCIVSRLDEISSISPLSELLQSGDWCQSIFEQLEVMHLQLEKSDASARAFVQQLMQEVMSVSIATGKMSIDDWQRKIEMRKEAKRVEDAAEFVYKKFSAAFRMSQDVSVYDFFYNKNSPDEISRLLDEAKDSLMLASSYRGMTQKRGQGMSRLIIDYIRRWQELKLMKPMKSVFPFCQCLQHYWGDVVNLGTRQGLEAMYKQKM